MPKMNLANVAVSAVVANAITEGLFQANLIDFFTGKRDGVYKAGADGSMRLTLPEILGFSGSGGFGGTYSQGYDFQTVVMRNAKANAGSMIATAIIAPAVAHVAMKVLRKPVILPANRLLKQTGLSVKLG
jgi:hypothetical protein